MIIGIIGKKQSGKNTVANMLQYFISCKYLRIPSIYTGYAKNFRTHYGSEIRAFADPLKEIVSVLTYTPVYYLDTEKHKNTPIPERLNSLFKDNKATHTYRELLQYLGTDVFRSLSNSIWIDALLEYKQNIGDKVLIVPDVRFPNEAEAIAKESKDNVLIKVIRSKKSSDSHISETSVDSIEGDYTVYNQGSLKDLFNNIRLISQELFYKKEDFELESRIIENKLNY